jgi:uncharacterized DUF497 family protein
MQFDWDRKNASANLRKHGVSFGEAATRFDDEMAVFCVTKPTDLKTVSF